MSKAKCRKLVMKVSFNLPPGVTIKDGMAYTKEAIQTWCGCYQPPGIDSGDGTLTEGDPIYDLDQSSVRVSRLA